MSSENPEMSTRLFLKNQFFRCKNISCKYIAISHPTHFAFRGLGHWQLISGTVCFWSNFLSVTVAVVFWNSYFCFYWNSCFLISEPVFYWTSFFYNWNSYLFFLSNFLGWVGRLAREGKAPRTLYMHICIWKAEISTSFSWNINQLIFS